MLKRLASTLPPTVQQEMRRWKIWLDIKRGKFASHEPEFRLLSRLVADGEKVLDIGANVGYYTLALSKLVGASGHVFSFEPITSTSEMLHFALRYAANQNVTVFNTAVSDKSEILHFSIGQHDSGLPNYFVAQKSPTGNFPVLGVSIDSLTFPDRIAFAKIDTEGAELSVLRGMEALIERDHPVLVVEGDESLEPYLAQFGYRMRPRQPKSANLLFGPPGFDMDSPEANAPPPALSAGSSPDVRA